MQKSNKRKTNKLPLSTLLSASLLILSACAQEILSNPPPDVVVCTSLFNPKTGLKDEGYCRYTATNEAFVVKGPEWEAMQNSSVIMPAQSFAAIKTWEEVICHQINCANGVGSWDDLVQDIHQHLQRGN